MVLTSYVQISLPGVKTDYERDIVLVQNMEPLDSAEYFLSKIKGNRIEVEDVITLIQENPREVMLKVLTASQIKTHLDQGTRQSFSEKGP